jgi:hypothetical protein
LDYGRIHLHRSDCIGNRWSKNRQLLIWRRPIAKDALLEKKTFHVFVAATAKASLVGNNRVELHGWMARDKFIERAARSSGLKDEPCDFATRFMWYHELYAMDCFPGLVSAVPARATSVLAINVAQNAEKPLTRAD